MRDLAEKTIVIFGSSKPKPESGNYLQAYELGKALAEAGYRLANGGYGGTMAAAAQGAPRRYASKTCMSVWKLLWALAMLCRVLGTY